MPTPYETRTELFIDGAWVNATTAHPDNGVRAEGGTAGINIIRGVSDQQSRTTPQMSTFTLNNRDGIWSSRNPLSPYYGLITRNIPVRHGVMPMDSYVKLGAKNQNGHVRTSDKAALDIVGDLDIRIEVDPKNWRSLDRDQVLASKWEDALDQRSWVVRVTTAGLIAVSWTTTGTAATANGITVLTPVPANSGRLALRIFFDVVNGANKSLTVQTSDHINGTYVTLGTITTATSTSIFSGTAPVEIGSGSNGSGVFGGVRCFWGKIYAFQLRNSAGVLVAEADFTAQDTGTTSFADAYGNAWELMLSARIGSDRIRYIGELSELPHRWDKSGNDVYIPVVASGVLRRMGQGAKALRSSIFRSLSGFSKVSGYWPMEDGSSATAAASALTGGASTRQNDVTFSATQAQFMAGTEGGISLNSAASYIGANTLNIPVTGTLAVLFYFRCATLPATDTTLFRLITPPGYWEIKVGATGFVFEGIGAGGVTLASAGIAFGAGASPLNQWVAMRLQFTQEGVNVRWSTMWHAIGGSIIYTHLLGGTTYVGTVGRASAFHVFGQTAFVDTAIAHVIIAHESILLDSSIGQASVAYNGETAGARFSRLCTEEGVAFELEGLDVDTEAMGPQQPERLLDLLYEVQSVDGGILSECRDILALRYRTRKDMYGNPAVVLDYAAGELSEVPDPTDDDSGTENDVTIRRENGSSATVVVENGPLSVRDPTASPPGAGRYNVEETLNVATDAQLAGQAGWRALLGTVDQVRIPGLEVALHREPVRSDTVLTGEIVEADLGDAVRIDNPPFWLGPGAIKLQTLGYEERLSGFNWSFRHNTVPGVPYDAPVYDGASGPAARYDTSEDPVYASYLAAPYTSSDTALTVATPCDYPNEAEWVTTAGYPAEFPLDVVAGGERMTVTAITDNAVSDTFTRVTASGWGTATSGQTWATGAGSASDYSTDGTMGLHNLSTVTTIRESILGVDVQPFELYVALWRVPVAVTGAGASSRTSIVLCRENSGTLVRLRTYHGLAATNITCNVEQYVGGVLAASDTTFPSTGLTVTTAMSARIQVFDDLLRARVWAAGAVEPIGVWTTQVALTVVPNSGSIAVQSDRTAASTNVPPFYVQYDGFVTPRAQVFTTTRAVNGISKAQTEGTAVRVYDSAYWAL